MAKSTKGPSPCPYCNSTLIAVTAIQSRKTPLCGKYRVYCPECKLFVFKGWRVQPVTTACDSRVDAIMAWNNFCEWVSYSQPLRRRHLSGVIAGTKAIDYEKFLTRFWEHGSDGIYYPIKSAERKNDMDKKFCEQCDEYHTRSKCPNKAGTGISKFWMVVCFEGTAIRGYTSSLPHNGPRVRHVSKHTAEEEATRLSKEYTSKRFVVLEATDVFYVPSPEPVKEKL